MGFRERLKVTNKIRGHDIDPLLHDPKRLQFTPVDSAHGDLAFVKRTEIDLFSPEARERFDVSDIIELADIIAEATGRIKDKTGEYTMLHADASPDGTVYDEVGYRTTHNGIVIVHKRTNSDLVDNNLVTRWVRSAKVLINSRAASYQESYIEPGKATPVAISDPVKHHRKLSEKPGVYEQYIQGVTTTLLECLTKTMDRYSQSQYQGELKRDYAPDEIFARMLALTQKVCARVPDVDVTNHEISYEKGDAQASFVHRTIKKVSRNSIQITDTNLTVFEDANSRDPAQLSKEKCAGLEHRMKVAMENISGTYMDICFDKYGLSRLHVVERYPYADGSDDIRSFEFRQDHPENLEFAHCAQLSRLLQSLL